MAEDERSEEEGAGSAPRRELRAPGSDPEKALTLEVARLFGMSPRQLVNRPTSAEGVENQGDDLVAGDGHAPEGASGQNDAS